MTDTDHLSTPADLRNVLKQLTTILREIETLPEPAQQRFWDDLHMPAEELQLGAQVSLSTVTVMYNVLRAMCGARLTEMVNGEAKEYLDRMLAEMQSMQNSEWDDLLDQKFKAEVPEGTEPTEGAEQPLAVSMTLRAVQNNLGQGLLSRVPDSSLLKLKGADGRERYFSSKDIVLLQFETPGP